MIMTNMEHEPCIRLVGVDNRTFTIAKKTIESITTNNAMIDVPQIALYW